MSTTNNPQISSGKKPDVPKFHFTLKESPVAADLVNRPRGATFSYSPYESKDPSIEIQYRPIVAIAGGNATPRTMNWFATAADEEVNTVQLLSGLSHSKKVSYF
jgi:hypothetical protein